MVILFDRYNLPEDIYEVIFATKQQIIGSRSFGHKVTDKQQLREAIAKYTTRAAEKLRGEKRFCRVVSVFIRTSPFIPNEPQYANTLSAELPNPTDDTRDLLEVADVLFRRLWRAGFRYAKAGVMLADFYEHGAFQQDLFRADNTKINSKALMSVVDQINHSGLGNVFFASQGVSPQWSMKREHLSPRYTTKWGELPEVW